MRAATVGLPGFVLLGLALLTASPAVAQAEDPEAYGDDYQSGDYGRLRFIDGGATIQRAGGEDVDDRAATNSPLFPGDRVGTDRTQRLEIELAGGTIVRLDGDTELTLQSLPRPTAEFRDNTVLLLDRGVVRANVRLGTDDEFRIDTPAGSVYLLGDGDFRIEADPTGRTSVYSRRGVAEVVGEGGSVLVRGGSGTAMQPGTVPEDPRAFRATAGDPFDRWVDGREAGYRTVEHQESAAVTAEQLPGEVRPYYRELSAHGRWVDVPDYGWAWSPYSAGAGWRPYYDGYWSYGPGGYFWVGNEPWGWAPYRYGRWSWLDGYGWFWVPGRVFAGAWVSWSWGSFYVGWAPLDYWGGPAYYGGGSHYYGGHYDAHCWTVVDYQHMGSRDLRRHAVPIARAGDDVQGRPAVLRAPKIPPSRLAGSREWRERAVREVSADPRYRVRQNTDRATPARRLQDVEDRLVARGPKVADGRDDRSSRGDRAIRDSRRAPSADPGRVTPGNRVTPERRATPGNRATPENRAAPENRMIRPTTGTATRERTTPSLRPPSVAPGRSEPGRAVRQLFPRRIVTDPRAADRAERPKATGDPAPAPRDGGGRELAPRGTNENVRELYDRLSRTGEMRRTPPRTRASEESRPAPAPNRPASQPRAQTESPQRRAPAETRREPAKSREQARPETRPAPAPRAAPAKPAPNPGRSHGDAKRNRR